MYVCMYVLVFILHYCFKKYQFSSLGRQRTKKSMLYILQKELLSHIFPDGFLHRKAGISFQTAQAEKVKTEFAYI